MREKIPPRFAVDCMLGKLAKWLRILGFDTVYFSRIQDEELLALARREGRVLLTRDYHLSLRMRDKQVVFIESDAWPTQLRQVLNRFQLRDFIKPYSRCLECNCLLQPTSREAVRQLVPHYVYTQVKEFSICPCCSRVYWRGTHFQDMERKIAAILGEEGSAKAKKGNRKRDIRKNRGAVTKRIEQKSQLNRNNNKEK